MNGDPFTHTHSDTAFSLLYLYSSLLATYYSYIPTTYSHAGVGLGLKTRGELTVFSLIAAYKTKELPRSLLKLRAEEHLRKFAQTMYKTLTYIRYRDN